MAEGRWCSTTEATALLGVTRPTVLDWLKGGTLDGQVVTRGSRKLWQVDRASVQKCLEVRGGPGARRGRPPGSLSALTREVVALRERLDQVESELERLPGGLQATSLENRSEVISAVLTRLITLLASESATTQAQMVRVVAEAEQLTEELAPEAKHQQ